jgi:hypothetical protein
VLVQPLGGRSRARQPTRPRGGTVVGEATLEGYFPRFNQILAETDILWSKPSEINLIRALGLPLVLSPPVGVHEGLQPPLADRERRRPQAAPPQTTLPAGRDV